jgi:hypothetical protein
MSQKSRAKKPATLKPVVIGRKTILERVSSLPWQAPAGWGAAIIIAVVHVQVVMTLSYSPDTVAWLFPALLAAPALLTMLLLKGGFGRWYRWAAICGLFLTTYSDALPLVLTVGEAWALHRQWVTERDGGLAANFRRFKLSVDPANQVAGFLKRRTPKTA